MKEELRIHSFIHFNGDIKTCHVCHQIFKTNRLLNIHMQKHETKKTVQCSQCGDFFTFKSGLAKHVRLNRCKGASNFGDESFKLDEEKIAEIALSQLKEITKVKAKVEDVTVYEFCDDFDNLSDSSTQEDFVFEPILKVKEKVVTKVLRKVDKKSKKNTKVDKIQAMAESSKKFRKIRKKKLKKLPKPKSKAGRAHLIYTCDYCGEKIKFKKNIQDHMKQHVVRYRCKECCQTFKSRKKLVDHSIEAHGVKPQVVKEAFSCEFCGRKFDVRSTYEAHKLSHDDTARHKICSICSAAFKSVGNLRRHEATHATTRDFHCISCPKSFKTRLALKIHKEVVHAEMKVFVNCGICQSIVQEKHLNQHIKNQHTEEGQEKPFECSVCGKTFRTFQLGQRHYEAVHEPKDRGVIYSCPHCPELQFFRQRELKEHSFIHFDGTIFQCDECLKMFKSRRLLMIHRASHNEFGGYPCKFCDNIVFKTRGGRRKHMLRLHTDEKIEIEEQKQNEKSEKQCFVIVNHQILRH